MAIVYHSCLISLFVSTEICCQTSQAALPISSHSDRRCCCRSIHHPNTRGSTAINQLPDATMNSVLRLLLAGTRCKKNFSTYSSKPSQGRYIRCFFLTLQHKTTLDLVWILLHRMKMSTCEVTDSKARVAYRWHPDIKARAS